MNPITGPVFLIVIIAARAMINGSLKNPNGTSLVQPSGITLRRPHGPWVCSKVVRLRAGRLGKIGNTGFTRTVVAVESFETVGKTMIYQSVNHAPNIQPTAHRVWYSMTSLGRTAVSQRLSPRSGSEVSHDHASSLAKVVRNDKGGNLEQREKEHAKGLWPWNGPRCGDFPEFSDPVWRSLRAVDRMAPYASVIVSTG
jgi:hypothetical protein